MKATKKLLALLLALTMVFGLATTAFADEPPTSGKSPDTGTIVIMNPDPKTEYKAYRLLDLEYWADTTPDPADPIDPSDPTWPDVSNGDGNYVYRLNEEWDDFFGQTFDEDTGFAKAIANASATTHPGMAYVNVDSQGYVTWKTNADVVKFAEEAIKWAKEHEAVGSSPNQITQEASATCPDTAPANGLTLTDTGVDTGNAQLPLGYYLVDTSLGSLCSLGTTDNRAEIREKNKETTEEKKIIENGNPVGDNNVHIGDLVNYEVTIYAKKGATEYVLHDKMTTPALEFQPEDMKIYKLTKTGNDWDAPTDSGAGKNLLDAADTLANLETADYWLDMSPAEHTITDDNVPFPDDDTDGKITCTFEVKFSEKFLKTLTDDNKIVVKYTALVTDEAVIGDDPDNVNKSRLEFGEGNFTAGSETHTETYELNIWKYYHAGETDTTGTALGGAEFVLYQKSGDTDDTKYSYLKAAQGTDKVWRPKNDTETVDQKEVEKPGSQWTTAGEEVTDFYPTEGTFDGTIMKTEDDGYLKIDGLDAGTYYLKETKAPTDPENFNLLNGDIEIVIGDDGSVTYYPLNEAGERQDDPTTDADDDYSFEGGTNHEVKVENKFGREMPATGGMGTTLFYVFGGLLTVAAVVLLITKKRVNG